MKRILTFFIAMLVAFSCVLPAHAENGKVTYNGDSYNFVFEPGSEKSPTDLFPNLKDVMPGDTLTQKITVKNDASEDIKVKLYIRSLGAKEDSEEFLSQLGLKVQKSQENEMAYMFDAAADETAQLTDWVYLGMLYSGGEVNLDVMLEVPTELGNEFQDAVGYLDWEFKIEEFPAEDDDPQPPLTGDNAYFGLSVALMCISAVLLVILMFWKKEKE